MIAGSNIFPVTEWTTRDGRTFPMREMTNAHLINTFYMLIRQGRTLHTYPTLYGIVNEMCERKLSI